MHHFRNGLCSALPHRQIARSVHDVVFLSALSIAYFPYQTHLRGKHRISLAVADSFDAVKFVVVNPHHAAFQLGVQMFVDAVTQCYISAQSQIDFVAQLICKPVSTAFFFHFG